MKTNPIDMLPEPDTGSRARSERLVARLREEIARSGPMDFSRWMERALYDPGDGYYTASIAGLGEKGDFTTAPETTPRFGAAVARQCADVLGAMGGGDIVEFGGGSGGLARDVLRSLAALHEATVLPRQYLIVEVSPVLRRQQEEALSGLPSHLSSRVSWAGRPPEQVEGVILGNEFLDALPAARFRMTPEGPRRLLVDDEESTFTWRAGAVDPEIAERVAPHELPDGYESEVGLTAEKSAQTLAGSLTRGMILWLDYGFPRREFYHPQRGGGTLMCHYRHRVHADPFVYPGLQDITSHVDFTAVAEAMHAGGCAISGYTSQGAFLLSCGVMDGMDDLDDRRERILEAQAVRRLTDPHEMGEIIKVMAATKGIPGPLRGFATFDRRGRL